MERSTFGALARRHRLALSLFAVVAASAVILPACGGSPGDGLTPPTTGVATSMTISVTSSPASGTVLVGVTRQYAVEVRDQNNVIMTGATATWSLVGAAGIATITAGGGLTTCTTAGTITVLATGPVNQAGTNLTANATLVCVAPPVPVATTMTILVTSSPSTGTVLVGATRQYAIEVRDQNNLVLPAFTTAAWSIVGAAGVASISTGGLATCTAAGTVTVHAIGPVGGSGTNLTADASLQCILPPPVATTMTILVTSAPTTGTILVGATRQYAIEVRDQYNVVLPALTTAAWSILGTPGIAAITPTAGLATCGAPGTVTVHAIGPIGGSGTNLTADATLQCIATSGAVATVIVLTPSTVTTTYSAVANGTATIVATFLDASGHSTTNGCTVGFTMDASVAGPIASVSNSGLTATVTAVRAGTTTLRAACTTGSPLTALARIQVALSPLNIARVVMESRYFYFPASASASTARFLATAQDANGTAVPSAVIAFAISGGSAASTDQSGNVTVAAGASGAGGPFRGGAVLTASSGGQSEVGFVTYGDAGTIRGVVSSTTGQYVGGTTATATNYLTSAVTAAGGVTNDGYFYIVGLAPGTYSVNVTGAVSGQLQTFSNVVVTAGQQTVLTVAPFALRAGR